MQIWMWRPSYCTSQSGVEGQHGYLRCTFQAQLLLTLLNSPEDLCCGVVLHGPMKFYLTALIICPEPTNAVRALQICDCYFTFVCYFLSCSYHLSNIALWCFKLFHISHILCSSIFLIVYPPSSKHIVLKNQHSPNVCLWFLKHAFTDMNCFIIIYYVFSEFMYF